MTTKNYINQLIPDDGPHYHAYRAYYNQFLSKATGFEGIDGLSNHSPVVDVDWFFGLLEGNNIASSSIAFKSRGIIGSFPVAAMLANVYRANRNQDFLTAWTTVNAKVLLNLIEKEAHFSNVESVCRLFRRIAQRPDFDWVVAYIGMPGESFETAFNVLESAYQQVVDETYFQDPPPSARSVHLLRPVLAAYKRSIGLGSEAKQIEDDIQEVESESVDSTSEFERWLNPSGRLQHIARREHYFPSDIRYLALTELKRLGPKVYSDASEGDSTALIIFMALHTGTPVQFWRDFLAMPTNQKPEEILLNVRYKKAAYKRGYELPDTREQELEAYYIPGEPEVLSLPLPYRLVHQFIALQKTVTTKDINRYFAVLRNQLMLPVLSQARITRSLYQVLRREVSDRVVADVLCGKTVRHSPSLNYVNYSYDELLEKYRIAVNVLFNHTIQDDLYLRPASTNRRIGSKSTPTTAIVRAYLSELFEKIGVSRDPLIRMNLHTVWLWHVILLLTASRVVGDIPSVPREVDLEKGWWWVSDKEERSGKTIGRFVPLCPFLVTALSDYQLELQRCFRRLNLNDEKAYEYYTEYLAGRKPMLAVWDTSGQWQSVSHKFIIEYNKKLFPQPKNWTRHVSRSLLESSGLPAHLIDAVFGHEGADTELHNPYSSAALRDLEQAKAAFERMAGELGLVQPGRSQDG